MDECGEAWPAGVLHLEEAFADEDTVFGDEGCQVGEGGEGDEVEEVADVEVGEAAVFQHRVGELEGDAGTAEVVEILAKLGVDEGLAIGACAGEFVVIEDDEVHAGLAEEGCAFEGVCGAIHRDEEGGICL